MANGIITKPTINNVHKVLGERTFTVGNLCRSKHINMWSRYKPVNNGGVASIGGTPNFDKHVWSNEQPFVEPLLSVQRSIFAKSIVSIGDAMTNLDTADINDSARWEYNQIKNDAIARIVDFLFYNHYASSPFQAYCQMQLTTGTLGYIKAKIALAPLDSDDDRSTAEVRKALAQRRGEFSVDDIEHVVLVGNDETISGITGMHIALCVINVTRNTIGFITNTETVNFDPGFEDTLEASYYIIPQSATSEYEEYNGPISLPMNQNDKIIAFACLSRDIMGGSEVNGLTGIVRSPTNLSLNTLVADGNSFICSLFYDETAKIRVDTVISKTLININLTQYIMSTSWSTDEEPIDELMPDDFPEGRAYFRVGDKILTVSQGVRIPTDVITLAYRASLASGSGGSLGLFAQMAFDVVLGYTIDDTIVSERVQRYGTLDCTLDNYGRGNKDFTIPYGVDCYRTYQEAKSGTFAIQTNFFPIAESLMLDNLRSIPVDSGLIAFRTRYDMVEVEKYDVQVNTTPAILNVYPQEEQ